MLRNFCFCCIFLYFLKLPHVRVIRACNTWLYRNFDELYSSSIYFVSENSLMLMQRWCSWERYPQKMRLVLKCWIFIILRWVWLCKFECLFASQNVFIDVDFIRFVFSLAWLKRLVCWQASKENKKLWQTQNHCKFTWASTLNFFDEMWLALHILLRNL